MLLAVIVIVWNERACLFLDQCLLTRRESHNLIKILSTNQWQTIISTFLRYTLYESTNVFAFRATVSRRRCSRFRDTSNGSVLPPPTRKKLEKTTVFCICNHSRNYDFSRKRSVFNTEFWAQDQEPRTTLRRYRDSSTWRIFR